MLACKIVSIVILHYKQQNNDNLCDKIFLFLYILTNKYLYQLNEFVLGGGK